MAEEIQNAIPGTPGIQEVRIQTGSENFGFCVDPVSVSPVPGIRKVGLRAEIDTSPPFGSVQEAVTRFGGRGSWVPFKLGDNYNGEFDLKRMEEHAAELEKDLIVKELETLDVLEALGSTKRVVEDLKRQLHEEALRCVTTSEHLSSEIKEMNNEQCYLHNPLSSPDLILMELKQAKMNLGKTMDDLMVIQSSVESLNKKMKEEKDFLDKTRAKLGFGGAVSLAEELSKTRVKLQVPDEGERFNNGVPSSPKNPVMEQVKLIAESNENGFQQQSKNCLRTAEMRLVAARKMEEAAKAAEALAMAEITMLSNGESEDDSEFCFPEPPRTPLTPSRLGNHENFSRTGILKKLEEATEGVKESKQALEVALNRVEIANVKQLEAENAFRGWNQEDDSSKTANFPPLNQTRRSFFSHLNKHEPLENLLAKPLLRSNVSMRDVLRRKQVVKDDIVPERQSLEGQRPRRNANLSQMLKELKEDIKYTGGAEKEVPEGKQYGTQRRKFGFIHITLPLQKQSKKKPNL